MIYREPEDFRGRSFRGLLDYVLHDRDHATTAERVTFVTMLDLIAQSPDAAAREMRDLALRSLTARRAGKRPDRMAMHFVLSWHPDDQPTPQHMKETAVGALAALGLTGHQAVIVGHSDTGNPHVHVVVNVIDPETGRAAKLGWRQRVMSRWARQYERSYSGIRCATRLTSHVDVPTERRCESASQVCSPNFAL